MQHSENRILTSHVGSLVLDLIELVAMRIVNFANLIGRENEIAEIDCGFSGRSWRRWQRVPGSPLSGCRGDNPP
jgi:methionine synthase II (cobalamin-independent)